MHSCKPTNHPYLTMAKGNMLLGYARGAVGNLVFSRVKGNEVTKARNRQPANPKTSKQVYQRAKFLNAVNFYKRGVQNLFKFAYEDKTQQESDFNAFMRHNVSRAIPVGKGSATEPLYPAVSNWITSVGSLNGPQAVIGQVYNSLLIEERSLGRTYANGDHNVVFSGEGGTPTVDNITAEVILGLSEGTITTFGQMCTALKSQYPDLQEGDIVTVTMIHQLIQGIGAPRLLMPTAYGTEGAINAPNWLFAQFIIDSTSTTPLAANMDEIYLSNGLTFYVSGVTSDNSLCFRIADKSWEQAYDEIIGGTFDPELFDNISSCVAGVVTFSRETTSGLRVSTQEISTSEGFQQLIELSKTTAFTESVLRSWDAADMAILEGGFIRA